VDVVFGLLRVVDFFWWGLVFGGDWECVVEHDVVDGVFFCYIFLIVQVVCVQPDVKISYCSIFVLGGVVGGVWDDRVCECGFSVYLLRFSIL